MISLGLVPPLKACESYLELVEAQNTSLLREIPGHLGYRITPAITYAYFGGMHSFVDIHHECVEMNAAFTRYGRWEGIVKQVHEHRLPSPNITIQV